MPKYGYHNFLFDSNFHLFLQKIDQELAENICQKGCPHCGGKLHQADYPRSPLGMPRLFRNFYDRRFSFCCETCRRRTTSQSLRFFGRRWYPAPLFILISILTIGLNERRQMEVQEHFGINVSLATWKRWRQWWDEFFMTTSFWQSVNWSIPPPEREGPHPDSFFSVFQGTVEEKLLRILRFLSPLTVGSFNAI
jgi:hypothetical protein